MIRGFGNLRSVTSKRQSLKEESRVCNSLEIKREMPFLSFSFARVSEVRHIHVGTQMESPIKQIICFYENELQDTC